MDDVTARESAIIKEHNDWTLSLDGWKDCCGIGYYAVLLLDHNQQIYLGNLELDGKRHTALNIGDALEKLVGEYFLAVFSTT